MTGYYGNVNNVTQKSETHKLATQCAHYT